MKTIKAELWKIWICKGALAMAHDQYFSINEFYIPEYNISFNVVRDEVHIFETHKDRYSKGRYISNRSPEKIKDVQVSEKLAKNLKKYIELERKIKEKVVDSIMLAGFGIN